MMGHFPSTVLISSVHCLRTTQNENSYFFTTRPSAEHVKKRSVKAKIIFFNTVSHILIDRSYILKLSTTGLNVQAKSADKTMCSYYRSGWKGEGQRLRTLRTSPALYLIGEGRHKKQVLYCGEYREVRALKSPTLPNLSESPQ